MRSVIYTLFSWFLIVNTPAIAQVNSEQCTSSQKTSIYFSNGMFTDFVDANRHLATIERKLTPQLSGIVYKFNLSYNDNEGSNESGAYGLAQIRTLLGVAEQTGEVVFQTAGDRLSTFYRFIGGIEFLPDFVQAYSEELANAIDYGAGILDADVSTQVANYLADLNEGNRIIILAHSQGNFYSNIARQITLDKYVTQSSNSAETSISILSLASPASQVSGGYSHATLEEDFIINKIVRLGTVNSILPANITNSDKDVFLDEDWTGHGLVAHYLSGVESLVKTKNMFSNLLNVTDYPTAITSEAIVTVTLTWDEEPDVDLHIYEPDGSHVYYSNLLGSAGFLDRDDVTSYGPEHYFSSCDTLITGTYQIGVNYFSGSDVTEGEVTLQAGPLVRSYPFNLVAPQGSSGDNPPVLTSFSVSTDTEGKFVFTAND